MELPDADRGAAAALTGPGSAGRRADLDLGPTATVVLLGTEGRAASPALPLLSVPR